MFRRCPIGLTVNRDTFPFAKMSHFYFWKRYFVDRTFPARGNAFQLQIGSGGTLRTSGRVSMLQVSISKWARCLLKVSHIHAFWWDIFDLNCRHWTGFHMSKNQLRFKLCFCLSGLANKLIYREIKSIDGVHRLFEAEWQDCGLIKNLKDVRNLWAWHRSSLWCSVNLQCRHRQKVRWR